MKKILILCIGVIVMLSSCENQENKFDDYDYTAVYFPFQTPVRCISLGVDRVDNSLDREHKFNIGVSIGGMYENYRDWTCKFEVAPDLAQNLKTDAGDTVLLMPESYYTLSNTENVTIPSGSFNGLIQVQLSDAFFEDPLAISNHYVIPLRLMDTDADSILSGKPAKDVVDKRIIADWDANAPAKDFTLFMVKFVNEQHGSWLRRGVDYLGEDGAYSDTNSYRRQYVEKDQVASLKTSGRWKCEGSFVGKALGEGAALEMTFDGNNITLDSIATSPFKVLPGGTGVIIPNGAQWGEYTVDMIVLQYKYYDPKRLQTHQVFDTLVFRDRDLEFETFTPVVIE